MKYAYHIIIALLAFAAGLSISHFSLRGELADARAQVEELERRVRTADNSHDVVVREWEIANPESFWEFMCQWCPSAPECGETLD